MRAMVFEGPGRPLAATEIAPPTVRTQTSAYPLASANEALHDLRSGRLEGAAVLLP